MIIVWFVCRRQVVATAIDDATVRKEFEDRKTVGLPVYVPETLCPSLNEVPEIGYELDESDCRTVTEIGLGHDYQFDE